MGADTMAALEEQLRTYEDELMRLRVENEQLRQSSQAFGELAERLSVALRTATRVNRAAVGSGGRRPAARGDGILDVLAGGLSLEGMPFRGVAGSGMRPPRPAGASEKRALRARRSINSASNIFCWSPCATAWRWGESATASRRGSTDAVQSVVKLAAHPVFDIAILAPRSRGHQCPKQGFGVCLERGGRVLAELASRSPTLPGEPPTDPVHQHAAGAAGLAQDFAFNNVVGHDV